MQLREFFIYLIMQCKVIPLGNRVSDKSRLFLIIILRPILKNFQRFVDPNFDINKIIEALWRKIVVKIDNIQYILVDQESLEIIKDSESFISLWLKPAEGEVIIDIGAHIGKYTLKTAKIVGDKGLVVAIEANPINYNALQRNIVLNDITNAIPLNLAAWNKDDLLKLFIGHLGGHHSTKIDWNLGWYSVRARPIDDVIKEYDIGKVDWIKIDVEGAEWEVISGLKNTIDSYKTKVVIELSYENIAKVKKFLNDHSYGIIKISSTFEGIVYGASRKFAYFLLLPL